MKRLTTIVITIITTSLLHAQSVKVGTVDLNEIFEQHPKTKEARDRISKVEEGFRTKAEMSQTSLRRDYEKANELQARVNNTALSQERREAAQQELVALVREIQQKEQEMQRTNAANVEEIQKLMLELRSEIVNEISDLVKKYAKENNYAFVFDKTGQGLTSAPIVLFAADGLDFSAEIIKVIKEKYAKKQ
jgi:Skp family chaperone for outer membrane proteins